MATSYINLYFTNNKTLNVICAGDAVGASPPCSWEGAATSANSTDFTVPTNGVICVRDQINTATATAGLYEVYSVTEGKRTGIQISAITAAFAVTVADRSFPRLCLKPGNTYRLIAITAQA
jgi:hypothetical protein